MLLDYSSSFHYVMALLPELVLSVWGMVVLIAGVSRKQASGLGAGAGLARARRTRAGGGGQRLALLGG